MHFSLGPELLLPLLRAMLTVATVNQSRIL